MNKKLVFGIIAGVAVLAALIIGIIAIVSTFSDGSNIFSKGTEKNGNTAVAESSVTSEGDVVVKVPATKAKNNDTISIPVFINNNPGFYAATLAFEYDSSALTYTGYEEGDVLDQYELNPQKGKISVLINNSENKDVKKDGTLMSLKFKVKKASSDGKYDVTIKKDGTMLGDWATNGEVHADIALGEAKLSK